MNPYLSASNFNAARHADVEPVTFPRNRCNARKTQSAIQRDDSHQVATSAANRGQHHRERRDRST
jgi:hypothetical protein